MEHNQSARVVAGLLAPQRSGSRQELTRSDGRQSSSDLDELSELMEQMAGRYPHQDMSAAAQNYLFDYGRLMEIYGLQSVKTALLNLRIKPGQRFFPTPDEAAEELEAMRLKDQIEERRANPYTRDPECPCASQRPPLQKGLVWVIDKDGDRIVARCPCWRRRNGSVAAVDHKTVAAGE